MKNPIIETFHWLFFIIITPIFSFIYWFLLLLSTFLLRFGIPFLVVLLSFYTLHLKYNDGSPMPIFIDPISILMLTGILSLVISFVSKESEIFKKLTKAKKKLFNSTMTFFLNIFPPDKRIAEEILTYSFFYVFFFSTFIKMGPIIFKKIPLDINFQYINHSAILAYFMVSLKTIYEFEKSMNQ